MKFIEKWTEKIKKPDNLEFKQVKLFNILLLVVLFFLLELVYRQFIVVEYPEVGFSFEFSLLKYFETKIIFVFALVMISYIPDRKGFLYFISVLSIAIILIPNLIVYEFMIDRRIISYLVFIFIGCLFLFSHWKRDLNFKLTIIPLKNRLYILLVLVLVLLIPFFFVYGLEINWKVFIIKDIYQVRDTFKELSTLWTGYTYSPLGKFLVPVLFVIALYKRKYLILTVSLIAFLYLYMIGAHKILLFGFLLVIFLYFFRHYFLQSTVFLLVLTAILLVGYISYQFFNFEPIISLSSRRFLFYPALHNEFYYEFFQNNHIYLSHSILEPFFDYPYDLNPSYKISEVFKNNPDQSCNNGFISSGYMNFGIPGALGNIIFLGILFKFIDDLKIHPVFSGIFVIMLYTLVSSELMTALGTHGIILLVLIAYIFLNRTQKEFE